eukprot:COSAG02_NODE_192_length_29942_cov_34.627228_23_plen_98_part_00
MMNRAAAAMVTLEMRSDELARFLVATIGTSSHSTDAIARSFALRDPAVLLVRMLACLLASLDRQNAVVVNTSDCRIAFGSERLDRWLAATAGPRDGE